MIAGRQKPLEAGVPERAGAARAPTRRSWRGIRLRRNASVLACALGCSSALGCFSPDDGREPPLSRIYFPTGLALSPDGNRLYVANSDWDLQFNAGSIQAYDTEALRGLLPRHCRADMDCEGGERCDSEPSTDANGFDVPGTYWCVDADEPDVCRGFGVQLPGDRLVEPGLCGAVDNERPDLLLESVGIGAFATDLLYRENPVSGGGRLFAPVRSDATLHWLDVRGGSTLGGPDRELSCGQNPGGECDAEHRRHDAPTVPGRPGQRLPIEPFGIDADAEGRAIITTHQTEGSVSLFTNDWERPDAGPELTFILEDLPARPMHVSAIPPPLIARIDREGARLSGYRPGFWLAFRGAPFTELVRYFDERDAPQGRAFLETAFVDVINATGGGDVRALTVDASRREACESGCAGDMVCASECAGVELDVYLANRSPASLLIGTTTSVRRSDIGNDRLHISDLVAVDSGPSRVVMGHIRDADGELQRRVFLTSFDSRSLTIYDPDSRRVEARVLTGRGPSALAIDSEHALAYVAHFTDSYVGVIDLDRSHASFGTLILALGEPAAPRGDP